jgi:hypothetical protein
VDAAVSVGAASVAEGVAARMVVSGAARPQAEPLMHRINSKSQTGQRGKVFITGHYFTMRNHPKIKAVYNYRHDRA